MIYAKERGTQDHTPITANLIYLCTHCVCGTIVRPREMRMTEGVPRTTVKIFIIPGRSRIQHSSLNVRMYAGNSAICCAPAALDRKTLIKTRTLILSGSAEIKAK